LGGGIRRRQESEQGGVARAILLDVSARFGQFDGVIDTETLMRLARLTQPSLLGSLGRSVQ
jgi:hypothetical protein